MTTLKLALRNLFRSYRRTLAVVFTVAVGSGALFVFNGFNVGIMNQYRENVIRSRFGHGQIFTKGYQEAVYEKPWEHWIENPDKLVNRLKTIEGVDYVFPRIQFFGLLTNGALTLSGRGHGVDGESESRFFRMNVEEGEQLSTQEDGIVLGRGLARALKAKPGDRITVLANTIYGSINGADVTVVGVFHTGSKEFDDSSFRLPLKVAQRLLDTDRVESVALGLRETKDWDSVAMQAAPAGNGLEAIPFAILDRVYYQNAVNWLGSQFRIIRLVILFIVILGIFNTVSTGVLERKQEVGNLRANGESVRDVLSLFLVEALLMGVLGAIVGIVGASVLNETLLGQGILMPPSPGLTRQYRVFIELQPLNAIQVFFLGAVCALVGTIVPAWRVARMPIGEALRST